MNSSSKTRVILQMRLHEGMGETYAAAYDLVQGKIARAEGFISSQLCKSVKDPDSWIVVSEWQTLQHYLVFVDSEDFKAQRAPMRECVLHGESSQYAVVSE
jgi:heme-degrading monooxygenase HmoA